MASHFYIMRNGVPCRYIQTNKDGSERKYIRRGKAFKDGASEGLTSILSRVSDQGGIIEWAGRLGIEAGITACQEAYVSGVVPAIPEERAKLLYTEARERAANRGSEIHDAIERFFTRGEVSADPIEAAAQEAAYNWQVSQGLTSGRGNAEHCLIFKGKIAPFDTLAAFGGTTDWISETAIVDYKTVEPDKRGKYHTGKAGHAAQLAGYRAAGAQMGLCNADAKCFNLYISRKNGALVEVVEWTPAQLKAGLELVGIAFRAGTLADRIEAKA